MASVNKIILIGNVGGEIEMRFTPNGNPVADFTLAVNHYYQKDGERKEEVMWLKIITWNKCAEACNQFLGKGKRVYVEGRLRIRKWQNNEGVKGVAVEVVAERVVFLEKVEARPAVEEAEGVPPDSAPESAGTSEEELPF